MVPSLSNRTCLIDMVQKQKTATVPAPLAVFMVEYTGGELLREIQNGTAVVKHEDHCRQEKQSHKDVKKAVSLATRVFNFVHIVQQNFVVRKMWGKSRKAPIRF